MSRITELYFINLGFKLTSNGDCFTTYSKETDDYLAVVTFGWMTCFATYREKIKGEYGPIMEMTGEGLYHLLTQPVRH